MRDHPSEDATLVGQSGPSVSCDLCGAPMLDLHCKLSCRNCGYKRDCSDP